MWSKTDDSLSKVFYAACILAVSIYSGNVLSIISSVFLAFVACVNHALVTHNEGGRNVG